MQKQQIQLIVNRIKILEITLDNKLFWVHQINILKNFVVPHLNIITVVYHGDLKQMHSYKYIKLQYLPN